MTERQPPSAVAPTDTASAHATTAVPVVAPDEASAQVLGRLAGQRYEVARDLPVCERGRLVGMVRIEDLLAAPAGSTVADVMDDDPPTTGPEVDEEAAAWRATQRGESSLAVVDADRRLLGVVPPDRLLAVLLAAHDQDLARLSGLLGTTDPARSASREPVGRRLIHRLPWLLVGLAGALVTAAVLSGFEQRLAANVAIAFFIPGLVYMADAIGTQTEALVVRGLSVGVSVRGIAAREVLTGVLLGAVLAAAFVAVGLLLWDDAALVAAVAIALFAACACATLIALALPAVLARVGVDPAYGSGPLATVIQDLLTLLIYLGVVAVLLV